MPVKVAKVDCSALSQTPLYEHSEEHACTSLFAKSFGFYHLQNIEDVTNPHR